MSSASDSVRVTFFTSRFDAAMPETVYTIPIRVLPAGLSELVNSVLELNPSVPMDFFIEGEILHHSLERYLKEHSDTKSFEDILSIEYAPSITYTIKQELPHDDWVTSVKTVSFEESILLSGCYDSNLRLWRLEDGDTHAPECVAVAEGHKAVVKEVCLTSVPTVTSSTSANTRKRYTQAVVTNLQCASASKDGSVRLWVYESNANQFRQTAHVTLHQSSVESVDYQHTLGLLASGGWDEVIHVWNASEAGAIPSSSALKGHTRCVTRVRFPSAVAENNVTLLSTSLDGTVRVWDISGKLLEPIRTLSTGHAAYGLAVRGTNEAATGHTDGKVRLWDARTPNRPTHTWKGHQQWIYSVAYCGLHNVVSTSEDCTVRLWDKRVGNGSMLIMDTQHGDGVLDVAPCGPNSIATASKDNTVKITTTS